MYSQSLKYLAARMSYSVAVLAGAFTFAHVLGPSEYGRLGALVACGSLVITLATQGIRTFYLREAAGKAPDDVSLLTSNFVAMAYCFAAGAVLWVVGHWLDAAVLLALYGVAVGLTEYAFDRWRALQVHRTYLSGMVLRAISYAGAVTFVAAWGAGLQRAEAVFELLVLVVAPTLLLAMRRDPAAFAFKASLPDLLRASRFSVPIACTYAAYYLIVTVDRFVFISAGRPTEAGVITFHTDLFVLGGMAVLMALQLPMGPRLMAAVRGGVATDDVALNRRILAVGGMVVLVGGALAFEALANLGELDARYFSPGVLGAGLALGSAVVFAYCFYHLYLIQAARGRSDLQLISMVAALAAKGALIVLAGSAYDVVLAIATTFAAALVALLAGWVLARGMGGEVEMAPAVPHGRDPRWPFARPRTGDSVAVHADRVEKRVAGDLADAVLRHEVLWAASADGKLFSAPRVLSTEAPSSTLVLSRLELGQPLRDRYVSALTHSREAPDPVFCAIVRRIARVLAQLHVNAHDQTSRPFHHGDFGFSNVFVGGANGEQVQILDPIPSAVTGGEWAAALPLPAYDVATMMGCLYGRVPPSRAGLLLGSSEVRSFYGALFFSQYVRDGIRLDFGDVGRLARVLFTNYCRESYGVLLGQVAAGAMFHGIGVR